MSRIKTASRALSGFVEQCPIPRSEVEIVLGSAVSDEAWRSINQAFAKWGRRRDDLNASKASAKKDDAKSWSARQSSVVRDLEEALKRIDRAKKHGEFLREASDHYGRQQGLVATPHTNKMLKEAYIRILNALVIVERAAPELREIPTEAESRRMLANEIWHALSDVDCSKFANLIKALGVHGEHSRQALEKWINRAVGQK
ncbi:hypothetical protein [Defluviimonas salinarum]|uniref:Uncharacterized protein n=1 Tax=Defluviimonas salinarum TaxID=2992147 RepID=A0ABT3IXV5_9RHOB|nr:hypothetical protein [Defluviimonas salinarum]MCW3780266.1 hypothetical protein [Defluviimonas salinarum]